MKQFFNLKKENGVSLIEALIALFIIGIALVALMFTHSQSHRAVNATQRHSVAVHLAQQQLEALKRMDRSSRNRNDLRWLQILADPPINNTVNGVLYTTTTALIPASQLPAIVQANINIIPIRVTIRWPEPGAAGPIIKSISMDNYYYP